MYYVYNNLIKYLQQCEYMMKESLAAVRNDHKRLQFSDFALIFINFLLSLMLS
jgi:hypothetical protein